MEDLAILFLGCALIFGVSFSTEGCMGVAFDFGRSSRGRLGGFLGFGITLKVSLLHVDVIFFREIANHYEIHMRCQPP